MAPSEDIYGFTDKQFEIKTVSRVLGGSEDGHTHPKSEININKKQ